MAVGATTSEAITTKATKEITTTVISTVVDVTIMILKKRAERDTPIYVNSRLWIWKNLPMIKVDCRRHLRLLKVTVNHGHALNTTMFCGLFDNLPINKRSSPARLSTPMNIWNFDMMNSRPTSPQQQLRTVE